MTTTRIRAWGILAAASLAVALTSGCIGAPPPDGTVDATRSEPASLDAGGDGPNSTAAAPEIVVLVANGTITQAAASVWVPNAGPIVVGGPVFAGDGLTGTFTPEANFTAVVAELAWADPTWDLDLYLMGPDYEYHLPPDGADFTTGSVWYDLDGNTGSPDRIARIHVTEPDALALAGEWSWAVDSKTANAVAFTVYVSIFHGGFAPDGYTAVPAA